VGVKLHLLGEQAGILVIRETQEEIAGRPPIHLLASNNKGEHIAGGEPERILPGEQPQMPPVGGERFRRMKEFGLQGGAGLARHQQLVFVTHKTNSFLRKWVFRQLGNR
jgi:hypothetical protein